MGDQYSYYDNHSQQQHRHAQNIQHQHQQLQQQAQHQQHQHPHPQPPHPQPLHHSHQLSIPPGIAPLSNVPPPLNLVDYGAHQYYDAHGQVAEPQQLSDANIARWFEQESEHPAHQSKSAVRMRRRAPAGADHIKHRRTRSGCYTCRSRRVKCDETHPICERCKKGSRECVYPEPTSATKPTSSSKLGQSHRPGDESDASSEEYEDDDVLESPTGSQVKPEGIGPQRSRSSVPNLRGISKKQSHTFQNTVPTGSISSEQAKEKSLSPSTDDTYLSRSAKFSALSTTSTNTSLGETSWSHLPHDVQFFLDYHRNHLNHNFYFFKHDASHFVHDVLLEIALDYDPLLYAVVSFAAYHYTIKKPNGRLADFLTYYNKSVSLLRKSLHAGHKHTSATILTILQLAAFEEYLGDWVNLMIHQRAAYEMLNELYNPKTIMQTETSRKTFAWYARFDLFAGLMAGNAPTLGIEWYQAYADYYFERSAADPSNLDMFLESLFGAHRVMAVEMAQLFAKLPKGEISIENFNQENEGIRQNILACKDRLRPLIMSNEHKVMSFEGAPALDPDDFVDPYQPGLMFKGPLFSANYMLIDIEAIEAMHDYQTAMITQSQPTTDLVQSAVEQCRILEGIEYWPGSPNGALLPAQASLGLICLFLPRDQRHSNWCRRKLAKLEANGYIYPLTFREKMVEHWGDPSIHRWWLENDEGYPKIIKSIRSFIQDRTKKLDESATTEKDIREMKAIFSKLSYDDSPKQSPESISSSANDSGSGRHPYGSPQSGTSGSQHESQYDQSMSVYSGDIDQATLDQMANFDVTGGFGHLNQFQGYRQ